ncbi:MAG: ATP synthase F1 subunit delta [Bacteroidota bacterium]
MYTPVAPQYAQALLQQARVQGILTDVYASVLLLDRICTENDDLKKILKSPVVHHDKKLAILQSVLEGKVDALVLDFLKMIGQRRRTAILAEITQAFLQQYNSSQGTQTAHITTTFQLSDDLADRFKTLVKAIVPCQEVVLIQHIRSAILGGYILQVADKQLDMSLVTQLHALKKQYIARGY